MGRNLTPSPSPIALPPTGRGGLGLGDSVYRMCFHIITDVVKQPRSTTAPTAFPSPGRWEGDGRGDRGEVPGGGRAMGMVRLRAEEARLLLTPQLSAG